MINQNETRYTRFVCKRKQGQSLVISHPDGNVTLTFYGSKVVIEAPSTVIFETTAEKMENKLSKSLE